MFQLQLISIPFPPCLHECIHYSACIFQYALWDELLQIQNYTQNSTFTRCCSTLLEFSVDNFKFLTSLLPLVHLFSQFELFKNVSSKASGNCNENWLKKVLYFTFFLLHFKTLPLYF